MAARVPALGWKIPAGRVSRSPTLRTGRGAGEEGAKPLPNAATAVGSGGASGSMFPPFPLRGEKKEDKGGGKKIIKYKIR